MGTMSMEESTTPAEFEKKLRKHGVETDASWIEDRFPPIWRGKEVDLLGLYQETVKHGGMEAVIEGKLWKLIWPKMSFYDSRTTDASYQLKILYLRYLYSYEQKYFFGKTKPIDMASAFRKHGGATLASRLTSRDQVTDRQGTKKSMNSRREKGAKRERSIGGDDSDDVDLDLPKREKSEVRRGGPGRGHKGPQSNDPDKAAPRPPKNPLAYKRPFYTVSLLLYEIEEDLALISSQKRRRGHTRANQQALSTEPLSKELAKCVQLIVKMRHHKYAYLFNKPADQAGWPEAMLHEYYHGECSSNDAMDMGMIQTRLSLGEYGTAEHFIADMRAICRDACTCAKSIKEFRNKSVTFWEDLEKEIKILSICESMHVSTLPKRILDSPNQLQKKAMASKRSRADAGVLSKPDTTETIQGEEMKKNQADAKVHHTGVSPEKIQDIEAQEAHGNGSTAVNEENGGSNGVKVVWLRFVYLWL
mmetsp:Transcript_159/g.501  ORF Transcript_159/g.501 Transcript_159/m.501 type:complete len:475 (-) Transcript_159:319-1743(-)